MSNSIRVKIILAENLLRRPFTADGPKVERLRRGLARRENRPRAHQDGTYPHSGLRLIITEILAHGVIGRSSRELRMRRAHLGRRGFFSPSQPD
jgi:hypothetical protein